MVRLWVQLPLFAPHYIILEDVIMNRELSSLKRMIEMFTGDSIVPYSKVSIKVPKEAKTVLFSDFNNDLAAVAKLNNNIVFRRIMPDIKDVVINDEDGTSVVIVEFCDGTSERAVLSKEDTFNFEQGISVCITKKLLSMVCPNGNGLYNKIIKRAMNVHKNRLYNEAKALKKKKEEAECRERKHQKNEKRRVRREMDEREKQIEIHKEAYLRAMREYNKSAENEAK